jgi:hypothetical protein
MSDEFMEPAESEKDREFENASNTVAMKESAKLSSRGASSTSVAASSVLPPSNPDVQGNLATTTTPTKSSTLLKSSTSSGSSGETKKKNACAPIACKQIKRRKLTHFLFVHKTPFSWHPSPYIYIYPTPFNVALSSSLNSSQIPPALVSSGADKKDRPTPQPLKKPLVEEEVQLQSKQAKAKTKTKSQTVVQSSPSSPVLSVPVIQDQESSEVDSNDEELRDSFGGKVTDLATGVIFASKLSNLTFFLKMRKNQLTLERRFWTTIPAEKTLQIRR